MKKVLYISLILLSGLLSLKIKAQSSSIQIKDLIFVKNESTLTESDSLVDLRFFIKVSDISQSDSIYVQIGTISESSNLLETIGTFVHTTSTHQLNFNGTINSLKPFEVFFDAALPEIWFSNPLYITVFLIDSTGNSTLKRSLKLN